MIPLQLTLKNFLSYREATLDFRGLHTACICGANGAGKSSLLEAITWAIWGESRTASDDDVIHIGTEHVRVDFQFISNQQIYRIIRSRHRGRNSYLEFQIGVENGFRSLSAKGVRATQEQIICYLKLDYDTFINSAYLRQGRADEFMLRRPNERKQILADLMKLDRYEALADRAKELAKQFKGQAEQLDLSLEPLKAQLAQREIILAQKTNLATELEQLQQAQDRDLEALQQLQVGEHQRQTWSQQYSWQQTQYQNSLQDCDRLQKEQRELTAQLTQLQQLLAQEIEITARYQDFLNLQQEEEILSSKFQAYQEAQQQKQELEQHLLQQANELTLQIRQIQTRIETLEQQEQEIAAILSQSAEITAGLEKLRHHRQRLQELDRLQHQVTPLLQRRYTLQTEIERAEARLIAKLEQLQVSEVQLSEQIAKIPAMRQAVIAVDTEIQDLEKKQIYQKRVHEKGDEKKGFQQRLQENQRIYQEQLEELEEKLQCLEIPKAICPLCEQELDDQHRNYVIQKTQDRQQEIRQQIWVIQDQITVCERELQVLRAEYRQLGQELAAYALLQQQFGQLEAQLEAIGEVKQKLKQIQAEIETVEDSLVSHSYAQELQSELQLLNGELQRLNYDEQTHALIRGEVERWRWAEIKQAKLEDAKRRQATIGAEKPKLIAQVYQLQSEIQQLTKSSEIKQEIDRLESHLNELGYERSRHQSLLNRLRQSQTWQLRYQELQNAQQQFPQLQTRLDTLDQLLNLRLGDQAQMKQQLESLASQIEQLTDKREEIQTLEQHIQQRRQQLDELFAMQGRLDQSLTQLDSLKVQYEENCQKLQDVRKQYRIHQELSQAFGKNGIQALMIENILPQLEAETNQILARLTGNQLHVMFLTQKSGKSNTSKKKSAKLIDTLEIQIADVKGTRSYETYSGGEAFRINFSIRLALAKLLAQRAGTSLQMLIVDEGFGTQDTEGCDRLIAAINAIAPDFACILTVTHMPQFKEAFEYRIEVRKTNQGSQISLFT